MWVRIFGVSALFFFSVWFPDAYKRWTHAFRPAKCLVEWPETSEWDVEAPSDAVKAVLEQPFSYFSKGKQCYVFLSQDGKYVLKLFRFDCCRMPLGQEIERRVKELFGLRFRYSLPRIDRLVKSFHSCKLAYSLASEQTGVVYVHLNPKPCGLQDLKVKDRLGQSFKMSPEKYRFILQKKAVPILKILSLENVEKFNALLDELSDLGLVNLDLTWQRNFGMLEGRAVQMDVGDFIVCPERAKGNAAHYKTEFARWLIDHSTL